MLPNVRANEHSDLERTKTISFARQILPILSDKCFACHGPDTGNDGLVRLDSFDSATTDLGGYQAINPEDLAASELITRILSEDDPMPPRDAEKQLSEEQRKFLVDWVMQGGEYEQHWAYVPPQKAAAVQRDTDPSEAIDYFVKAKLSERQLAPAERADRATLARRAALILTGLPPELPQLQKFLKDDSENAYENFVDELLASSRFGEHQARYWLDAVRYGDTHGLHLDNRRGIYPYRDWVVRAFNQNLPLNDFITWQLAGDLLPNPSLEQLTATGFVRLNPSTGEGGAIGEEFQAKNNFDRTETLGTVLLGTSLVCARCHTHKYDPIPQREYYALMAFFNSTAESPLDGNSYTYGDTAKVPSNQQQWDRWYAVTQEKQQLLNEAELMLATPESLQVLLKLADSKIPSATTTTEETASEAPEYWQKLANDRNWQTLSENEKLRIIVEADTTFSSQQSNIAKSVLTFEEESEKTFTTTLVARDLPQPRPTRILRRGEYDMPVGDPVDPNVISVLGTMDASVPRNRLGLANWLTSPDHPLVARVLVNRLWQQVFGYGLVRTPEEFGSQGEQPTHPELLDWLAVELHDSGWDLKHMLRSMVTSATFQQNSAWRADINDPENRLLARGPSFRLDAEVIRDIGLWASGLMDPTLGGEGVKPYQPDGMWKALAHPASNTKQYVPDTGTPLYRRSLYIYWKRTSPHPMMTLFDAPDRESSCVRRSRTNTSLQSLGLFNETQRIEMGRMFAERLIKECDVTEQRLELLFNLVASRAPSVSEQSACRNLLEQMLERYDSNQADATALLSIGEAKRDTTLNAAEVAAWTQVCIAVLASDITLTVY